ncbi:unnamed protein product [Paramecium primaurelia]|uniref:Centromere protein J C-terminal domain-containing protein n=1 Tax=Paramecium primaurelia TaxID=5886 RepID=A0A8S1LB87_PARPR|nr:unnamed protein product [Paramecium primaurelia]
MNLEEYLSTRMQEMSKFYNQLNIPIYDIKCNIQVKEQQLDNRSQKHFEQKHDVSQNSFMNEFIEETQNQQNQHTDIFDEIPIKGAQKSFEQLLQDQGIVQEEKKDKKEFLKKGTRQYLSNAQTRSELSKREHQEILKMNNENATEQQQQQQQPKKLPVHFLQKGKGKQCTQKVNDSILDHTKNDESIIQQNDDKNELKKERQQLEQQQKELQRLKIQQQKQLEQEKQEFEKWKEEEKKKIERITKKHYTIQQQRQQQLTTKQLEELDFLRKRVAQQNEEIKELKLQLEKSQQQIQQQQLNNIQNTSTHNINKLIAQSSPPQSNYSTKASIASENKVNSYAMMHNKQGCINEEEEFESQNGDDQNSYQNGDSYEQEKIKIDLIQLKNQPTISIDMINDLIDESEFEFQNNKYYMQYLDYLKHDDKVIQQNQSADGKISRTYQSGKKEVVFNNGVKREVFSNGFTIVHFTNNDKKQTLPDGTIVYYFGQAKTTQITIQNGPQIYRFSNNQIEIHFQNGEKQIRFSDGTKKYIYPNGEEETLFSDGIFQKVDVNKIKYIEYPDGKIEITHPDGRIENQSPKKQNY